MEKPERAVRDPVHHWITFYPHEQKIIDHPFVQRLRYVSQLTSADLVFPGGTHNRFSHSIGAMHVAGMYMRTILKNSPECLLTKNKKKYKNLARMTALLHDVAHGPYSHSFDRSIYQKIYHADGGHDIHRSVVISDPEMISLLKEAEINYQDIYAIWNHNSPWFSKASQEEQDIFRMIGAITQGPLGADRIDFVLRDSYHTGTQHLGTIAHDRIISKTTYINGHLVYNKSCLSDIIQALTQRFHMYESVYLHKTSFAANIIIEGMMENASRYLKLVERTKDLAKFKFLTDHIIGEIMAFEPSEHPEEKEMIEARKYCQMLLERKIPKMIKEILVQDEKKLVKKYEINMGKFDHTYHYSFIIIKLKEIYPEPKYKIIRTRVISEIDTKDFDAHHILFLKPKKEKEDQSLVSCEKILKSIDYTPSVQPFYMIRVYKFT
jgi:HD superfamily phosphohydrolase